ncbi:acetoacetate decarboxylase family protein [Actinoplanes sp. NPDC049265]|uniref:acetoacetate decarboxylase family protein n=1 Tax=Actinoplanes sp. NPDC049265 TaxID=3363902 RepID=UPI00371E3BFA
MPLTAKGNSSLASAPPWHYVGDLIGVEFWATAAAAEASLPSGLDPDPTDSGHGHVLFIDWQFNGSGDEYLDPVRSRYSECMVLLDAAYQGQTVAWCPFIFVDNDTSMARGWVQGFSKKLGQVHQTRAYAVASQAGPVLGAGGTFAGTLSVAGRRIAEGRVTLTGPSTSPAALSRPIVNLRHFPRLQAGRHDDPVVHELAMSVLENVEVAGAWTGTGSLSFFPAPGEELADLVIQRTGAGFRSTLSFTVADLKILD